MKVRRRNPTTLDPERVRYFAQKRRGVQVEAASTGAVGANTRGWFIQAAVDLAEEAVRAHEARIARRKRP